MCVCVCVCYTTIGNDIFEYTSIQYTVQLRRCARVIAPAYVKHRSDINNIYRKRTRMPYIRAYYFSARRSNTIPRTRSIRSIGPYTRTTRNVVLYKPSRSFPYITNTYTLPPPLSSRNARTVDRRISPTSYHLRTVLSEKNYGQHWWNLAYQPN